VRLRLDLHQVPEPVFKLNQHTPFAAAVKVAQAL